MKYTKIVSFLAMTITALAVMSSCEDDVNSKDLLAYIELPKAVNVNLQCAYDSEGKIIIANTGKETSATFTIVAGLSRETSKDARLNLALDHSLIEAYNTENNTTFVAVNNDAITLEGDGSMLITSGETMCAASIGIDYLKLEPSKNYLIPIKLESVSSKDKGIFISNNTNVAYLKITTGVLNNIDRTVEVPTGSPIDRTKWTVTATDPFAGTIEANMLDGDAATVWRGQGNKYNVITVNLGSAKAVKAFRLLTATGNMYNYSPKTISVEGSSDGNNWEMFGTSQDLPRPTGSATPAITNYIKMIYAKPYQHYRLTIKTHWFLTYGSCIAELDALE